MYARSGKITAQPGKRAQLAAILTRAASLVGQLPGCRMYLVYEDLSDESALWVTEVWDDREAHAASLQDERVRTLIAAARPISGEFSNSVEMKLIGGHGLQP
ncbi:MAG: antibiotic biosynthesis monooxygenase [Chloroflexi bacterium]|nr:antibiotic biosynthesis monooxygenase [Chloroflexota bacterium]